MSIIRENKELYDVNCLLSREGDVEIEDDELDLDGDENEHEESKQKLPVEESAEIFHEDNENLAISECF